jgi:D-sedoheptulose 7-phosphate isomerase
MADMVQTYFQQHAAVAAKVAQELSPKILAVGKVLVDAFAAGGKLMTCGNGGSAADAQHFAEEMIGRFLRDRKPIPAISLTSDGTALTCIANDYGFGDIFARQVTALAKPGDVFVGISTSGNSENVLRAFEAAKKKSAITIGLLGRTGGKAAAIVDHALIVPSDLTSHIQEMHIMIIHLLCEMADRWAAGE